MYKCIAVIMFYNCLQAIYGIEQKKLDEREVGLLVKRIILLVLSVDMSS